MADKMRAIWKKEPKLGLEIGEAEVPKIKDDEVLIKVKATSICGTDKHIYHWDEWAEKRIGDNIPYIFGHEVAGEIVEMGKSVKGLQLGDHVSAETHISCGYCFQCKTGQEHICKNVKILGVDTNGTFAEYFALPYRNAWKNDKNVPHWIATAQEPLGNAVHTVFSGEVAGKTIFISGMGPIGVCAVALCKAAGADKVIASGTNEFRQKFAKEFGADISLNPRECDIRKEVMDATNGEGVDVFLEFAGAPQSLKDGLAVTKAGGRVSVLGVFPKPFEVDVSNDIVFRGITLHGINGRRMFDTWYKSASFLRSGAVKLEKLVTHRFKLDEIEKGFEALDKKEAMKIVLEP